MKLQTLGVAVNQPSEDMRIEGHFERCNTPEMVTTNGIVMSVLVSPESATLMQDIMPPQVLVDYVQGEMEQVEVDGKIVEQPIPWPSYQVDDGEGGLTEIGAGGFQRWPQSNGRRY